VNHASFFAPKKEEHERQHSEHYHRAFFMRRRSNANRLLSACRTATDAAERIYSRIDLSIDRLTMAGMNYRRFESYFIILFLSPHSHIPSKIGMSDFPRSVKLYSTFGGIWGYSSLCTRWNCHFVFSIYQR